NSATTANGRLPIAEYVVSESDARSVLHSTASHKCYGVTGSILQNGSIEGIAGAGHGGAEKDQRQQFSGKRVPGQAHTLRVARRLEEFHLLRPIELQRIEIHRSPVSLPVGYDDGKAHSVVERQFARGFPVVLRVPFDGGAAALRADPRVGL